MGPKSFGGQNLCLPKICWTQNIGVHLELKENLELECGPAQPNLFYNIPDYDTMAIIITRTERVRIWRPHLVATIARAINICEKDRLRCREKNFLLDE